MTMMVFIQKFLFLFKSKYRRKTRWDYSLLIIVTFILSVFFKSCSEVDGARCGKNNATAFECLNGDCVEEVENHKVLPLRSVSVQ